MPILYKPRNRGPWITAHLCTFGYRPLRYWCLDYIPRVHTRLPRRKLLRRLALLSTTVLSLVLALPGLAFAQNGPSTADLSLAMDTVWVIITACLVLFMQAGFAMLEVGFSRMKNVGSVVAKILVNLAIAALLFWAVGFALAFGTGNALIGTEGWFLA